MLYTKSCFFNLSSRVIPSFPAICRSSATFFAVQFDDVKHLLRDSKGGEARGFVGTRLAPVALKDTQGGLYLVWVEGTNLASSSARPFPFHDPQVADLALVQGELKHGSNLVKA